MYGRFPHRPGMMWAEILPDDEQRKPDPVLLVIGLVVSVVSIGVLCLIAAMM